jgi:hypothetical protein
VLLADGAFLQRPELDPYWDLRIYVGMRAAYVERVSRHAPNGL